MTADPRTLRQVAMASVVGLGAVIGMLTPVLGVSPAAGLLAAVLTVALAAAVIAWMLPVPAASAHASARRALRRALPHPAQSDPDARGHARPRAPGRLQTAA